MRPGASPEAERQLDLRYRLGAMTADAYFEAGFDVVASRESTRGKTAYQADGPTIADLDTYLRSETPRIGLWLDSSEQTPDETIDEILARREEARV